MAQYPSRHPRWRSVALSAYAGGVGVAGAAALVLVVLLSPPLHQVSAHPVQLGVLAVALVLGELLPVPISRWDSTIGSVTISTTFAVALLVLGPVSLALLVHAVAVGADDVRTRRRPLQVLFNCGQYTVSLLAARAVFTAVSGTPFLAGYAPFSGASLLAALTAGAVFMLVNDALVAVVAALVTGQSVQAVFGEDLRFKLETSGVLVALGPVAALVVGASVLMVPLLVLPVLAVRRTALAAALREHQSMHDPLTGLANRALFRRRVEGAVAVQHQRPLAVLMLDLDHFKDVNDTLGHHVGDELLREVARRVAGCTAGRGRDTEVARLGGDEFAVLLVADRPEAAALDLAEHLLRAFARPFDISGTRLSVRSSIGITTTGRARLDDVHSALKQADIALYEAKQERARATVFDPATMVGSTERLLLLPQLAEAIEQRQLVVHHQPQVDARTGRVVGVEALVRWDHPTQGRLGPAEFIPLAEGAGMIAAITTFVLEEALAAAARWRRSGWDLRVAVNLSPRQLSDLDLPGHVGSLLARAGVPASALTIEVTESSLMADPRAARTTLRALREMGVELAIDDFGTGYSSLVLLQQLDVDELKVDRSFVTGLVPGGHDEVLVRSIIELGHSLGLRVVGEGVETQEVAAMLRSLGCDRLQGHACSLPVERGAVDAMLRAQAAQAAQADLPALTAT